MSKVIEFSRKRPKSAPQVVKKRTRETAKENINHNIRELLKKHKSPESIAKVLKLSVAQVRGRISALPELRELNNNRKNKNSYYTDNTKGAPASKDPKIIEDAHPWARAKKVLDGRAKKEGWGFYLDGVPSGLYAIIREANRKLKSDNQPQIIGSPEWEV